MDPSVAEVLEAVVQGRQLRGVPLEWGASAGTVDTLENARQCRMQSQMHELQLVRQLHDAPATPEFFGLHSAVSLPRDDTFCQRNLPRRSPVLVPPPADPAC